MSRNNFQCHDLWICHEHMVTNFGRHEVKSAHDSFTKISIFISIHSTIFSSHTITHYLMRNFHGIGHLKLDLSCMDFSGLWNYEYVYVSVWNFQICNCLYKNKAIKSRPSNRYSVKVNSRQFTDDGIFSCKTFEHRGIRYII